MAKTREVKIVHDPDVLGGQASYDPPSLTVDPGDSVVWINEAEMHHSATNFDTPDLLDTGLLEPGAISAPQLFEQADMEIAYGCVLHDDMAGTLIVRAEAEPNPDPGTEPEEPTVHTVTIVHDSDVFVGQASYDPPTITVRPGDSVIWINTAEMHHSATNIDMPDLLDTGLLEPGATSAPQLFEQADMEIAYGCLIHSDMKGKVIVGPAVEMELAEAGSGNGSVSQAEGENQTDPPTEEV